MFFGNIEKLKTTTDTDQANEFLKDGWFLIDVITTTRSEFLFLLGFCQDVRAEILGYVRAKSAVTGKTL